jgi:hypothetical protein
MDEAQVRDAVERMSRHIVQALARGDHDAYRAAFRLPNIGAGPGRGVDAAVLGSLLAVWAGWAGLLLDAPALEQLVEVAPEIRPLVVDLLDAGVAGEQARLQHLAFTGLQLPRSGDLWSLLYVLAVGYTTMVQTCGGLTYLEEVRGALETQIGPDELAPGSVAVPVVAAVGTGAWAAADRILQTVDGRPDGMTTLATMMVITVRAAARVLAAGPAGPALGADDARFPSAPAELDLPARSVRIVRQAIAGHLGAAGDAPPPGQLLRLPDTAHVTAAVLYAAQIITGQLAAAVQHYVDLESAALDPDRR